MRGVAIHLSWPYREDRGELASRFERTLAALRSLGLRAFRDGPRDFDAARGLDMPASATSTRVELTAMERGRPRGLVRAELLLRPPPDPAHTSKLRIEHEILVQPRVTSDLMRELVTLWAPLWASCGAGSFPKQPSVDDAPVVGWLTFLSDVYGAPLSPAGAVAIEGRGSLYEAKVAGPFDPKIALHKLAVTRLTEQLEGAPLLHRLGELLRQDLGWQGDAWRLRAAQPIWQVARQPAGPPKTVAAESSPPPPARHPPPMHAPPVPLRVPEPLPIHQDVVRPDPARLSERVGGHLPIASDVGLYAALSVVLELVPDSKPIALSLCGLDDRQFAAIVTAWTRRLADQAMLAEFRVKRLDYRHALERALAGAALEID